MKMPETAEEDSENGYCPKRGDRIHCEHWWDGDAPCCTCKATALTLEQQRAQGMIE